MSGKCRPQVLAGKRKGGLRTAFVPGISRPAAASGFCAPAPARGRALTNNILLGMDGLGLGGVGFWWEEEIRMVCAVNPGDPGGWEAGLPHLAKKNWRRLVTVEIQVSNSFLKL